ncbi:MAG TPA: cytochrome c oxidase subunit II [Gemmatimonadaceae bacterium]|nr:cytochrome c oxidase subunit II [Gemmatimonadaceae bacterium]
MSWTGSIFDTAGSQAEHIAKLAWFIIAVSTVTYVLVLAATAIAVRRARGRAARGELADQNPDGERRLARGIAIATVASTLLLLVYVTATARTGRAIAWPLDGERPLTVEVTGHQWWWEFRYTDSIPSNWLSTSNELHIPVGRPIQVVLQSNDVIHSFWIPELHGKQDVIPGHKNTTWLRADKPGVWKARCAEFCGIQHAKMAFDVVAESPAQFNAWYARQLASAAEPTAASARHGRDVFMQRTCVMCHSISGTQAGSRIGPELSHIATRPSIAAGILPNTRQNLGRWILNPQLIKPGVRMPANPLSPADMNALLDYLETLK